MLAPHSDKAKLIGKIGSLKVWRFVYFLPFRLEKLKKNGEGILPNLKKSWLAKIQIPFFFISELVYALIVTLKEKPKLIHAHWTIPQGVVAVVIKKITGRPILVTAHAADVFTQNPLFNLLNRWVINNADSITTTSLATRQALFKNSPKKTKATNISMGVDTNKFKKLSSSLANLKKNKFGSNNQKLILYVGRLAEKKGLIYLIKAMPTILKKRKRVHLAIIGSGFLRSHLEKEVKRLNLEQSITFLGRISNEQLPFYYNLADIFVVPSIKSREGDQEGLPVVLMEAMACQLPVVSTKTGGISDLVKNGETGFLVKQKSSLEIAKAVNFLLDNKKLRQKFGTQARKTIQENYSWPIVAAKFTVLYRDLIAKKPPQAP